MQTGIRTPRLSKGFLCSGDSSCGGKGVFGVNGKGFSFICFSLQWNDSTLPLFLNQSYSVILPPAFPMQWFLDRLTASQPLSYAQFPCSVPHPLISPWSVLAQPRKDPRLTFISGLLKAHVGEIQSLPLPSFCLRECLAHHWYWKDFKVCVYWTFNSHLTRQVIEVGERAFQFLCLLMFF